MTSNVGILSLATLCVSALSLIITIVSLSTVYWSEVTVSGVKVNNGLWKSCSGNGETSICISYGEGNTKAPDFVKASEAAMCLAVIASIIAIITWLLWTFSGKETLLKLLKIATFVFLGVSVFWNLIAVIVYAAQQQVELNKLPDRTDLDYKLSWSWGLAIFAAILEIIAIVLAVFSSNAE